MTNEQLFLAIGVPILFNGLMFIVLNSRFASIEGRIDEARTEFRELIAAERRTWVAHFKHVVDKLDEMYQRLVRLEERRT